MPMPMWRLAVYLLLAAWSGGAGTAWTINLNDSRVQSLIATTVIQLAAAAIVVIMGCRDWRRGRLVLDDPERAES